jgi:hypothetical protein
MSSAPQRPRSASAVSSQPPRRGDFDEFLRQNPLRTDVDFDEFLREPPRARPRNQRRNINRYEFNETAENTFVLNARSRGAFQAFLAAKAPANHKFRLFLSNPRLPSVGVFASTPLLPVSDALGAMNELYKALEETYNNLLDDSVEGSDSWVNVYSEGFTANNPWDLLSLYTITVVFTPIRGGCNKRGEFMKTVNDMQLKSFPSRDNNCGFVLIRQVLGDNEFLKRINDKRELLDLPAIKIGNVYQTLRRMLGYKGGLSKEQLKYVCDYLDVDVGVMSSDETPEEHTRFVLHDGHWFMLLGQNGWKQCKCGRWLRENNTSHVCDQRRNLFYKQYIKGRTVDQREVTYDFETRGDVDHPKVCYLHDQDGRPVGKTVMHYQVPTLVSWFDGQEVRNHLGVDCVNVFLDWLYEESKLDRFYIVRGHNAARFDSYFCLASILERDPNFKTGKNLLVKGTNIIQIQWQGHTFLDTGKHLPGSLAKLCKDFRVKVPKIAEVTVDGKAIPSMELCLMRPELGPQAYIDSLNPEEKRGYLEYCDGDVISLFQVQQSYNATLVESFEHLNVPLVQIQKLARCPTAPGMAMALAKWVNREHLPIKYKTEKRESTNWWWIPDPKAFNFIVRAKIGGISHVQHAGHFDGPLAGIDVKSLYPTVFMNGQFPRGEPRFTEKYELGKLGVYLVRNIKNPGLKIGCIPDRTADGRLNWAAKFIAESYITSHDIENMTKHKYKFKVIQGYVWDDTWQPFREMISVFKKIKQDQDVLKSKKDPAYNNALRETSKLIQNACFGKCLESARAYEYKIVSPQDLATLQWDPKKGESLQFQQGRWFLKKTAEKEPAPIQFGVFILSQSRQIMQNYFDLIGGPNRQNIIASETDSCYVRKEHLKPLLESNVPGLRVGEEYGDMVIEYEDIRDAYFLGKKCYAFNPGNGEYKFAFKGVPQSKLSLESYKTLYRDGSVRFNDIPLWQRTLFNNNTRPGICVGVTTKTIKAQMKYTEFN